MRNGQTAANTLYSCLSKHDMQVSCFSCCFDKIVWQKHLQKGRISLSIFIGKEQSSNVRLLIKMDLQLESKERWILGYSSLPPIYSVPYCSPQNKTLYIQWWFSYLGQPNLDAPSKINKVICSIVGLRTGDYPQRSLAQAAERVHVKEKGHKLERHMMPQLLLYCYCPSNCCSGSRVQGSLRW